MRYIIITITLIFNLILQSTLFEYISIIDVKPNSAIVIIISMAFMRGKTEGAVTGLIAGLLQDCFFAPYIGFYTFCYILVGYFCGMFFRGFYKETIMYSTYSLRVMLISVFFSNRSFFRKWYIQRLFPQ